MDARYPPNARALPQTDQSWFEVMQKNKPQSNSVAGGLMYLLVSGLHIGWGIWRTVFPNSWMGEMDNVMRTFLLSSFYIGAIVGSIIGTWLLNYWRKKRIYYLSGFILTISSILFIAAYQQHEAILCGRLLAGLGHGIVYVTTIIHAAENLVKEIRGRILSVVSYMIVTSIFTVTALYTTHFTEGDMIFGIVALTYIALGLVLTPFLTYESVPFLLKRGLESEAIDNMLKLRNESFETWTIRQDLQEFKLMLSEETDDSINVFSDGNAKPLMIMTATRMVGVLSSNIMINWVMIELTQVLVVTPFEEDLYFGALIMAAARFTFAIIPLFALDYFRRKKIVTVTGAMASTVLLIYTVITVGNQLNIEANWLATAFFVVFQAIISLGIDPLQHVLVTEAFSVSRKSYWSIAFVTTVEYVMHIILMIIFFSITMDDVAVYVVLFVTALGALFLHLILEFYLPETGGLSLRQAKLAFRNNQFDYVASEE